MGGWVRFVFTRFVLTIVLLTLIISPLGFFYSGFLVFFALVVTSSRSNIVIQLVFLKFRRIPVYISIFYNIKTPPDKTCAFYNINFFLTTPCSSLKIPIYTYLDLFLPNWDLYYCEQFFFEDKNTFLTCPV